MTIRPALSAIAALALLSPIASAEALVYTIDPVHSGITFKIRHFVNKVPGGFAAFQGEIHFDEDAPGNSKAAAVIETASVSTRNEQRDNHLRTADFFNSSEHPEIKFVSTSWKKLDERSYEVSGELTMLDQTHPVTLAVEYLGTAEGQGQEIAGWQGTTTLDRTKWGMSSNMALGDAVEVELNIQGRRNL